MKDDPTYNSAQSQSVLKDEESSNLNDDDDDNDNGDFPGLG